LLQQDKKKEKISKTHMTTQLQDPTPNIGKPDVKQDRIEREPPKPGEVWTHYKGDRYYIKLIGCWAGDVTNIKELHELPSKMVCYQKLDKLHDQNGPVWVQPLSRFMEEIQDPSPINISKAENSKEVYEAYIKKIPRFTKTKDGL
jgi:hypothetical protein